MDISYEHYKVFYHVARLLSISKAARFLNSSQPNITRTIKKLETELECELFIRTNTGVILTRQGKSLYKYVNEAYKLLSTGEAEIAADSVSAKRSVSIGLSVAIPNYIIESSIIPSIGVFSQAHPDTHLLIVNKPTPELITDVREGLIDMAIITSSGINNPEESRERVLLRFSDTIIAGNKFRDDFKKPASFSYILGFPIIGFAQTTETFSMYDYVCASKGCVYHVNIEITNYDQALAFVQNNIGLGCIPEYMALPAIEEGLVFEVRSIDRLPQRRVSILRNDFFGNPSAAVLEDYIVKHFQHSAK
ncbi:MAG: LysR family transcriptional regulator [Lachnospiraceae bacterium]|nr:LysR family transcriptional regulator [Lachnospiraceae bacterium]